jgi:hypothetical protein
LAGSPAEDGFNNASDGQGRPTEATYRRFIEGTVVEAGSHKLPASSI